MRIRVAACRASLAPDRNWISPRGVLGGDSLSSNAPLAGVIANYVDENFMMEVAREHARGRRLLIGTTNLDAQRPVIWDMGRIASSGHPQALELFRNVLLASTDIPGVFPPVYIDVASAGEIREEMHVDGGTTNQVFLLPMQIRAGSSDAKLGINPVRKLFIIRNGRVDPEFKVVEAGTLAIAGRSISTLIKTQGVGDLYQMYEFARRNRVDYNLAYIPGDFPDTSTEAFDKVYMSRLFEVGVTLGQSGGAWTKKPPSAIHRDGQVPNDLENSRYYSRADARRVINFYGACGHRHLRVRTLYHLRWE